MLFWLSLPLFLSLLFDHPFVLSKSLNIYMLIFSPYSLHSSFNLSKRCCVSSRLLVNKTVSSAYLILLITSLFITIPTDSDDTAMEKNVNPEKRLSCSKSFAESKPFVAYVLLESSVNSFMDDLQEQL